MLDQPGDAVRYAVVPEGVLVSVQPLLFNWTVKPEDSKLEACICMARVPCKVCAKRIVSTVALGPILR